MRIIGGRWRGSRLHVADSEGLRPTPDRVRETLFNWLAMDLPGASVLDCFAGSGALGLEAASRGAGRVTLVERTPAIARSLRRDCERLHAERVAVVQADALGYLQSASDGFDVVFIDPPYALVELREQAILCLSERQLLNPDAKIYIEWPQDESFELPHARLQWLKRKTTGQVVYALAQWCHTG